MKRNKKIFCCVCLVLFLVTTLRNDKSKAIQTNPKQTISVFLKINSHEHWAQTRRCLENIAEARTTPIKSSVSNYQNFEKTRNFALNLHVAIIESFDLLVDDALNINREIKELLGLDHIYYDSFSDIEFSLLKKVSGHETDHLFLQIASMSTVLHRHSIECLCGTPSQVLAILNEFNANDDVKMINPHGFTLSRSRSSDQIYPILSENFFENSLKNVGIGKVKEMHVAFFGEELSEDSVRLVADKTFWARPVGLLNTQERFRNNFNKDFFTFLIPSLIQQRGFRIVEMIPAPKIMALYFPQYHAIPENDKFWGKNFTEWTLLRPIIGKNIAKPLAESDGGLGYYNLLNKRTRIKQSLLAKSAGVYGFVYYHYWFSGHNASSDHKVMHSIPELVLTEEQPSLPFMLSWANEPWSKRWTGEQDDVMLSQEYGDENDWEEHFYYLLKFFKHRMYIKMEGKPAFIIYRIGHINHKLEPMIDLWNRLALVNGLPGVYVISTVGSFFKTENSTFELTKSKRVNAVFHFSWHWFSPRNNGNRPVSASLSDIKDVPAKVQYWGTLVGFDNYPRRKNLSVSCRFTVNEFKTNLCVSFESMSVSRWRDVHENFYFLMAWNEWNEQAMLEPSDRYKFEHLDSIRSVLQTLPARLISPIDDKYAPRTNYFGVIVPILFFVATSAFVFIYFGYYPQSKFLKM